jgi:hypothetical protein
MTCILNMMVSSKPLVESCWFTDLCQYMPWFHTMSPRTKFQLMLKFFHVFDNSDVPGLYQPGYELCVKCSPFVGHAYRVFGRDCGPHE